MRKKQPEAGPTREQRLADAKAKLEKQYGKDVITLGIPPLAGRLPTGSLGLDVHTASPVAGGEVRGGWPFGHITLLWAGEATGKTLLCCHAIREVQRIGGVACFMDFEKATLPNWIEHCGADPSKVHAVHAATLNTGFDAAREIIRADPGLVIIDSLVGLETASDSERSHTEDSYGGASRDINRFFRTLTSSLSPKLSKDEPAVPNNTVIMVTNQEREAVGQTYGERKLMPGGKAQRHQSHVWMRLDRVEWVEEGSKEAGNLRRVGQDVTVQFRKNIGHAPQQKCTFRIFFSDSEEWGATEGMIDVGEECLRWGKANGIVELAGAWWHYGEIKLGQGERAACRFLRANPEVQQQIENRIRTACGMTVP